MSFKLNCLFNFKNAKFSTCEPAGELYFLKIYFVSQTGSTPPKFTFRVNSKGLIHFSYKRYLENKIRENFDLEGTPIVLQFKNKNEE